MPKNLKAEISQIVKALKDSQKTNLAKQIEENWDRTCLLYSRNINKYKAKKPIESIMREALTLELKRLAYTGAEAKKIVKYLESRRILQTTPHISPAQKP